MNGAGWAIAAALAGFAVGAWYVKRAPARGQAGYGHDYGPGITTGGGQMADESFLPVWLNALNREDMAQQPKLTGAAP